MDNSGDLQVLLTLSSITNQYVQVERYLSDTCQEMQQNRNYLSDTAAESSMTGSNARQKMPYL